MESKHSDTQDLPTWLRSQMTNRGIESLGVIELHTGISRSILSGILNGKTKQPEEKTIRKLADYFRVDPEWLLVKAGYPRYASGTHKPASLPFPEALNVVLIPVYEQAAGLGVGRERMDWEPVAIALREARNVIGIRVSGDSMLPTIQDGDIVVIDRDASWKAGNVVLASHDDKLLVKRVYPNNGEGIQLRSDNGKYPPMVAPETAILGVVIAFSRRI